MIDKSWEQEARATPSYVSPLERQAIAQAIPKMARSPAISVVGLALVAIGTKYPIRPGDVMDVRFEDLQLSGQRIVLTVRRRRGLKGQKTAAAEHPLEFIGDAETQELRALLGFRESRGGLDGQPLWGPTVKEARRVFAAACALISRLCKEVTGDPSQSFYSLRHSVFSDELEAALMPGAAVRMWRRLKHIAAKGSHRDPTTSVRWYFHLPMRVVRAHADAVIQEMLSTAAASIWSGVSENALHQRAGHGDRKLEPVRIAAIRESVDRIGFKALLDLHHCQPALDWNQGRSPAAAATPSRR